jgi:hypothetical protein
MKLLFSKQIQQLILNYTGKIRLTEGWKTKVWDVVEKEPHPLDNATAGPVACDLPVGNEGLQRPSCSPLCGDSATDARLDTGGWVALIRRGLAPRKKRRAYFGAITVGFSGPA